MYQTQSPHTTLALKTIEYTAKNRGITNLENEPVSPPLDEQLACFVSLHLTDGQLRGCIGTIEPRERDLHHEIIKNAVSACTRDSRFSKVKPTELEEIEVSVDVLSKPELIKSIDELDVKKYGIIITDGSPLRGVLLPNIEGIETVEQQITITKRKAGLANVNNESLNIYKFTSTRFY